MWPIIVNLARTYAPAVVLPFAVVIGFIGYNVEGMLTDRQTPSRETAIERRERRKELEGDNEKFEIPTTIFEKKMYRQVCSRKNDRHSISTTPPLVFIERLNTNVLVF
ncbi:unnamed protein product [Lepeophtheirus salmonis]|uniref:(salmon louse) hypothetical protein n=1 Tax=Lepeophtheirus salmonis TaxID=72036 RepID=A0A7R8GZ62_LEPSM|nr:unnamed protein product [Lepeophtheirus salmonis]CAF2758190.1 unnamed protein product [Lepeophtheirus salmonis]